MPADRADIDHERGSGLLAPVSVPSLVGASHDALRDLILSGRLGSGDRLNEVYLAGELGVSRGTLRVAVRQLVEEGLLVERPRQGVFVRVFSPEDVIDIYNLRIGLETVAARLIVARDTDLTRLDDRLEQMRGAASRDDLEGVMRAEYGFHRELCELSGNEQLAGVYRTLQARIRMALSVDNRVNDNLPDLPRRHEPLLAALRSGDGTAAASAAHKHIIGHVDEVLERLGADASLLVSL